VYTKDSIAIRIDIINYRNSSVSDNNVVLFTVLLCAPLEAQLDAVNFIGRFNTTSLGRELRLKMPITDSRLETY